ncbi:hypothetical protein FB451DRAFT_1197380 [Mycena latifolia]|nr:hypothetical protein FB451DRAFT_1197380 [Mycena latifolia]
MAHVQRIPHNTIRPAPYPPPPNRSSSGIFDGNRSSPNPAEAQSSSPFPFAQGSQRDFHYDMNPLDPTSSMNSHFPADPVRLVTQYSTLLGLDENRTKATHEFNAHIQEPMTRLAVNHVHVLSLVQQMDHIQGQVGKISEQLDENNKLLKAAWKLSDVQQDALKALLLNYLIRPANSYKTLYDQAMTYIASHRSKYHLEAFLTDEVIKTTIKLFLKGKINEVKSVYRKMLFKRVHHNLATLTEEMIHDYHSSPGTVKDEERDKISAALALQRKVALPLAARQHTKGADTGFWSKLEAELRSLVTAYKADRSADGWKQWEKEIIAADKALHTSTEKDDDDELIEPEDQSNPQTGESDGTTPGLAESGSG